MKKVFTLLTLALLSIGSAWATDVTVKRSIAYVPDGGTTDAVHEFTGYNDGVKDIITITADETAGSLTGTPSKTRDVNYNNKTTKYSAAKVYRNKNKDGADVYSGSYDDNCYVGFKLVIADGYRIDVSQLKAQVGVSDDNFKYKVVVSDGVHALYTSADKTAKKANANISTISITSPNKLVVAGTVYVRMYFTITNTGTSKYIQPLELSLTGDVATGTQYTISTVSSPDGAGVLTGSGKYYENQDVFLTASANGGYGFVNWTLGGSEVSTSETYSFKAGAADATYTANFTATTTYTITGEIAAEQSSFGTITNEGDNAVNEDDAITFAATPNTGYIFVKWQKDGADYSTDASITVTSTADATYTAYFQKLFTVTFDLTGYNGTITGKTLNQYSTEGSIDEKYADKSGNYIIPSYADKYVYNAGNVFNKWEDGDGNTYDSGEAIVLTKDITLTPTWTATTQTLESSAAETTVTWAFAKSNILFNDWQTDKYGYYTETVTVNGEKVAVPMMIANGKISNWSRTDDICQTNLTTTFTIPAVKGMIITIADAYIELSSTTIAGSTDYTGTGTKTISYTYTGNDATIDIVIGEDKQYLKTIEVTYPAMTVAATISSAGYATFVPSSKVSVPSGVKAYIVTATSANTATLSVDDAITVIPAGEPVIIKGDEGTYYFTQTTDEASNVTGNELKTGAVASADGTQYILANGGSGVGFYQATPGTAIAAGKAYLVSPSGAPCLLFNFFDDMQTTGVNDVRSKMADVRGDFFDLQGRKVANPTKGLYIVNGKKVIVK